MSNLPLIGSIVAVGGTAVAGGVAMELSKPRNQHISLAKNQGSSSLEMPKRCELFYIQSSNDLTVKKIEESDLRKQTDDSDFWKKVESNCDVKGRSYVAQRYVQGVKKWVYEETDQEKQWKVID
ncbi:hypothetical protein MHC_01685 [Mycoplasma haemocanis str. Illinois]|uniref:Uncharacterized protein n=1 Tax=Mycoplasma haemocanis (strain Illinois) TaxID=1111676 RepID=H6N6D1_MYCHN|nr:hypothetical protein [Mycoplasma haemocanis]AEW45203.1 hypothetical protein MHC_01685 [Mycoplasma haemocanis str. Illinois]